MTNNFAFILFFFLGILIYIKTNKTVLFPLETFCSSYNNNEQLYSDFDFEHCYIFTNIKIGSTDYNIKTFFQSDNQLFYIDSNCHSSDSSTKDDQLFYDRHNSETFVNTTDFNQIFKRQKNACYATEYFKINTFNPQQTQQVKEVTVKELNFILTMDTINGKNTDGTNFNCLNLGLQVSNPLEIEDNDKFSFFTQLKRKEIINDYCWSMLFEKGKKEKGQNLYNLDSLYNLKGKLLIGGFPHIIEPDNYYESQYVTTYTTSLSFWNLECSNVYYKVEGKSDRTISSFDLEIDPYFFLIIAPYSFRILLNRDYFNQYIEKGVCHYGLINFYYSFYCNKSADFTYDDLKRFPTIYFEHSELNYTFELTYEDYFVEKNDTYFFLINLDPGNDKWIMGNMFLMKYNFVFNVDTKVIGFYNPNYPKIEQKIKTIINKETSLSKKTLIIVIICGIVFTALGIIIGKLIFNKIIKKKRANELDDDYEYVSQNVPKEINS